MHFSLIIQFAIFLYSYGFEGVVEIDMQIFLGQVNIIIFFISKFL